MTERASKTCRRVCIALPAQGTDYHEMGTVLARVTEELGWETAIVRDGDTAGLRADALIMAGKCSAFPRFAGLLSLQAAQRPATILWHVEPLPPGIIPERAQRISRMLARCDWNRLPRAAALAAKCIPGRNVARDLVRSALSARLTKLTGWNGAQAHPRQWYHAVQHYTWLEQRHSNDWCDLVAASTIPRIEVLAQMGIQCEYTPLGYHSLWGYDLKVDRDIDVLFLGRTRRTPRRNLLKRIDRRLQRQGVKLRVVDRDCYGQDRTELLSRTRISLDLVQCTWELPIQRLVISMACGALVVSNWTADPSPFRDTHLVGADSDSLADTILHYLRHERERRHMAEAARQHVVNKLRWHPVVSRVLRHAMERRAIRQGATP